MELGFGYFVYVYIILAVALRTMSGKLHKRKLCVEYRISQDKKKADFLWVGHYTHESGCLQRCCRHSKCSAYNYLQSGTCQLLPAIRDRNEPEKLGGSSYVQLADCTADIVWQVDHNGMKASRPCLIWHRPLGGKVICPPEMLKGPDNRYCAGVGLNKGLYLPGWYDIGQFRLISDKVAPLWCEDGYFLQVRPNCSSLWQNYTVGDPIPEQAAQIRVWKDGTPV